MKSLKGTQTVLDDFVLKQNGPKTGNLSLSQMATRSFLDNRTEPALQPRDDIPISVLPHIIQQKVIIVAISEE